MNVFVALLLSVAVIGTAAAQAGAKKTGKGAPAKAEEKEAPKIEGIEIARRDGKGFLGIAIVDSTFKLSFYDRDKKPVAPDVARAALRWDPKYKVGEERVVLNPGADGKSLSSPRNIRPPYHFKLFITLIGSAADGGAAGANETYVIDFRA